MDFVISMPYYKSIQMKKIILLTLVLIGFTSCVTVRFPQTIKVDITVPENFDVDKMQILIDTLRGDNIDGTVEFLLHKKEKEVSDKTENK
jgi:hypothetical protein